LDFSAITGFIADNLPAIVNAGISVLVNLASGIVSAIPQLVAVLPQIISAIVNGIGNLMGSIVDIGENIVQGIWEGIQNMATWIKNKVTGFFSGIVDGVKGLLGIHSPSTVFADMGKNMALGLGDGWDNEYSHIRRDIENGLNFGTANVDYSSSMLGRSQSGLSNAFNNIAATMGQNFTITVQSVLDGKVIGETAYQYSRNKQRAYGT
jgi:phage-related protein